MRRRARVDVERRLARVEGNRGDGMCICTNPVRVAWTLASRKDIEETCSECGGALIVVQCAFNDDPPPSAKVNRTATFKTVAEKAIVREAVVPGSGSKIDLEKLTDEELADLRDAMTPPGEKRPARWKAARPAQKPQPARATSTKRKPASPTPRSAPPSHPDGPPVVPETEHTAEPPTKRERAGQPSEKAWTSQRSRRRGSLTRGVIEQDF